MKNNLIKFILMAFFALAYTIPTYAYPGGGPDAPDSGYDEPDPAPIDNWAFILIILGVSVGAYYFFQKQNKQKVISQN